MTSSSSSSNHVCGVCLVGTGRMGAVRAPLIFSNPAAKLAAVVDINPTAGQKMASRYGAPFFTSLEEALQTLNQEIHLVLITTPTPFHGSAIKVAVKYKKAIFTEKPVAEGEDKICELFDLCNKNNVNLMCGFQRRFDRGYVQLKEAVANGKLGKLKFVRVFFADNPTPPREFLLKCGGCPFMDLAPHDVDFVRWLLNGENPVDVSACGSSSADDLRDAGVLDNALMTLRFASGTLCTITMTRGPTLYGYDNRIEVFGEKGMMVVECPRESAVSFSGEQGTTTSKLMYSFPQRYEKAFQSEIELACRVALQEEGACWPVGCDDCVAAQLISSCAARAQKLGVTVPIAPMVSNSDVVKVRPIGCGTFGSYVQRIPTFAGRTVLSTQLKMLEPFTRSSGLDYQTDVLKRGQSSSSGTNSVYICTPDHLHQQQALECLQAGLHVLVEKPVTPDFSVVQKARENAGKVLMVGFHRRFDVEFQRCKKAIDAKLKNNEMPSMITIESYDPVPRDDNMSFVLRNSCCHDVDLICWLFPNADIEWIQETAKYSATEGSVIEIDCTVTYKSKKTKVQLRYRKEHPSYVQRVTVDGRCYGYDFKAPYDAKRGGCCAVYEEAYAAQLSEFAFQVKRAAEAVTKEDIARVNTMQSEQSEGYRRTFALLEEAAQVLQLPLP
eukprot:g585.t1